jgi:glycosyltransferase involved in cell wall biosynthesis
MADSVVLLNRCEALMLREVAEVCKTPRAMVVAIPPMAKPVGRNVQSSDLHPPTGWRAIFVGSDVLVQNRVTIAYLLDLWSNARIGTTLHIYGRQKGHWPNVPNVTFAGYVADIEVAYEPGSILVYPCFVPGGIKTKVLEAFSYGIPVIGNTLTFEGILPTNYPLIIDDRADLVAVLKDPASRGEDLVRAANSGSTYLVQEHTAYSFTERWRQVILGAAGDREPYPVH